MSKKRKLTQDKLLEISENFDDLTLDKVEDLSSEKN